MFEAHVMPSKERYGRNHINDWTPAVKNARCALYKCPGVIFLRRAECECRLWKCNITIKPRISMYIGGRSLNLWWACCLDWLQGMPLSHNIYEPPSQGSHTLVGSSYPEGYSCRFTHYGMFDFLKNRGIFQLGLLSSGGTRQETLQEFLCAPQWLMPSS